jgi:hypothetical protein
VAGKVNKQNGRIVGFCDVTSYIVVDRYQRFEEAAASFFKIAPREGLELEDDESCYLEKFAILLVVYFGCCI